MFVENPKGKRMALLRRQNLRRQGFRFQLVQTEREFLGYVKHVSRISLQLFLPLPTGGVVVAVGKASHAAKHRSILEEKSDDADQHNL